MMSWRWALEVAPRRVRAFFMALCLLLLVAPTWHVCIWSGHSSGSMACGPTVAAEEELAQRPVICVCSGASQAEHEAPVLSAAPTYSKHCLAQLLAALAYNHVAAPRFVLTTTNTQSTYTALKLAAVQQHHSAVRGRGPPMYS